MSCRVVGSTLVATLALVGNGVPTHAGGALQPVAFYPTGICEAAGVAGDRLVIADGASLHVWDVSSPEAPVDVAQLALDATVGHIRTDGGVAHAVTANFYGTPVYYAMSLTGTPTILGARTMAGNIIGFDVFADHVYASTTSQTVILDVSNPASPSQVGTLDLSRAVAGHGNLLVVLHNMILTVYDNTDPSSPTEVGTLPFPSTLYDVVLSADGTTAYVASEGIDVVDLTTPATPSVTGSYSFGKNEFVDELALTSSGLYATNAGAVTLLDVSGSDPVPLGTHFLDDLILYGLSADASRPEVVHVAVGTGAATLDFSTPASPTQASALHTGYYVADLVVEEVTGTLGPSVQVTTASDVAQVRRYRGVDELDLVALPPLFAALFGAAEAPKGIAGSSGEPIVFVIGDGGVRAVDIASEEAIVEDSVAIGGNGTALTMGLDHLYASRGDEGFVTTFDVSDPTTLIELGEIDAGGIVEELSWRDANSILAIATGTGGGTEQVKLFNLLNPATPQLIHAFSPGSDIASIRIDGNRLYMADTDRWIYIYDITDPASPVPLGTFDLGAFVDITSLYPWTPSTPGARGGEIHLLGVTVFNQGVVVLDVTDPASPVPAGSYDTADEATRVVVHDDVIYVADGFAGFYALHWDVTNPTTIGHFEGDLAEGGVRLRWVVASDQGIAGYDLRRRPASGPGGAGSTGSGGVSVLDGTLLDPDERSFLDVGVPAGAHTYELAVVLDSGAEVWSWPIRVDVPPAGTVLVGNHPNPFNPRTTISFELAEETRVRVAVHDVTGARVATLVDGLRPAGANDLLWDGTDDAGRELPAGLYPYIVEDGSGTSLRGKMVLLP
jgi:hypothetical protein